MCDIHPLVSFPIVSVTQLGETLINVPNSSDICINMGTIMSNEQIFKRLFIE